MGWNHQPVMYWKLVIFSLSVFDMLFVKNIPQKKRKSGETPQLFFDEAWTSNPTKP